MSKLSGAAILLAIVVGLPMTSGVPAKAEAPTEIAINRCNSQTIDDASGHIRDYDRHAAGDGSAQLLKRYGALLEVISILNEEREILNSVCSGDAQREAFFVQIAANAAWALALEADVAARLNASCPAAEQALPTMMLADAWLSLANIVNEKNGAVPTAFSEVIPKVQTRAQGAGLALPPWSDTSAYWRDQVHAKAKAAIATCPSPSPAPSG
ncbi:MAG TPA: hypothetical protein VIX60_02510 [Candidatus Cybelea sp.]